MSSRLRPEPNQRLDDDQDVDLAGLGIEARLDDGLHEATGAVEGADGVGHRLAGERLALAQGDEAEDELVGDHAALRLHADGAHDRVLGRWRVLRRERERRDGQGETGRAQEAAAEGELIHYDILWPGPRSV
jgi:hypothetical protein